MANIPESAWQDIGMLGQNTDLPALLGISSPTAAAPASGFGGLLGDALSNPLLNMGMGLLAASGPSTMPVSLGQALAQGAQFASTAQQRAMANQLVRSRIEDEARRRAATEKLKGLIAGGGLGTAAAGISPETLGLLFEADPEAATKGVLGTAFPPATTLSDQIGMMTAMLGFDKTQRELAGARASLEDTAISANAGLQAMDVIESIPGADTFLINPSLIRTTRQALTLGQLDPTGTLANLPSAVSGIPPDQLATALNAAETVNKQRNALGFGLSQSNQTGVAGLRARLLALGEGAGLDVQRSVFNQALERSQREAEKGGSPIDLGSLSPGVTAKTPVPRPIPLPPKAMPSKMVRGQVYDLPDGRQAVWNGKTLELL